MNYIIYCIYIYMHIHVTGDLFSAAGKASEVMCDQGERFDAHARSRASGKSRVFVTKTPLVGGCLEPEFYFSHRLGMSSSLVEGFQRGVFNYQPVFWVSLSELGIKVNIWATAS